MIKVSKSIEETVLITHLTGWRKAVFLFTLLSLAFVLPVVTVAIAGMAYSESRIHEFRAHHPAPGRLYSVDGYRMHLYCTGAGSPTIILESGRGGDWRAWEKIQPNLKNTTRVCSYDRAGLGWSEPRPGPRDADAIADQLHGLLAAAKIEGPIVLMGHSVGALYLRDYVSKYPQGVAGLVLVDGFTPDEDPLLKLLDEGQSRFDHRSFWDRTLASVGAVSLRGECENKGYDPYRLIFPGGNRADDSCFVTGTGDDRQEYDDFPASCAEARRMESFGDLPVLIFSRDLESGVSKKTGVIMSWRWDAAQERMKKLSSNSRRVIASGSSHQIHSDRPALVSDEVSKLIFQIRGTEQRPQSWNITITK